MEDDGTVPLAQQFKVLVSELFVYLGFSGSPVS